jgi:hypothetical protein
MFRRILTHLTLPLLLIVASIPGSSVAQITNAPSEGASGTQKKLLAVSGNIAMDLDLTQLNGTRSAPKDPRSSALRFDVAANSFFTILVFDDVLRGPELGAMGLVSQDSAKLPETLRASSGQLVIEKVSAEEAFDLVVRDAKTGFVFFNIAGHQYDYDAAAGLLKIKDGRLLISEEYAKKLGRPSGAGSIAGSISITALMAPIEITTVVNGAVESAVMPSMQGVQPSNGTRPGPDVIVGDLPSVEQPTGGSTGGFVGLGIGTTSCNAGVVNLNWVALPSNDHPVIPQNMYRMSGGSSNTERFEQIGQSWLKHAFTALTGNVCGFVCNGTGGSQLGSGCSDPYSASLNYEQARLGSRAWVNPFTGVYPRGDSATNPNSHTGHTHSTTSHRVLVAVSDLSTATNVGATYFAEGQYVTPHENVWCQANHGECNMFNNISYRRFNVTGTTGFSFSAVGATVRESAAINAWTGATVNAFEPDPGNDGIAHIAYKVTNPSAGVWHYDYAVYNQNLDRAIQSFSVPLGCGITVSNLGFHAPPQHPGFAADGTLGNAGYSSTAWASTQTANALSWNSETFAQNQNANAVRWGTLYNFRFDSNQPPQAANATVGFFKTGTPVTVPIQAPSPNCSALQLTSAASSKMHSGQGPFIVDLPLTGTPGVECRSGGDTGDHTIVFTFNNNVTSGTATVTNGAGSMSGSPAFAGNTMIVNLTGVTNAQQISVKLSGVTDSFAQVLSDTTVSMKVLLGDVNGTGAVSVADVNLTKSKVGATLSSDNCKEEVNLTGSITIGDVNMVKGQVGTSLSSFTPTQ